MYHCNQTAAYQFLDVSLRVNWTFCNLYGHIPQEGEINKIKMPTKKNIQLSGIIS